MKETRPVLLATESTKHPPLLIIDKKGTMGSLLAKQLQEQFLLVFVSAHEAALHKQIIHIPYRKKIPRVPDNYYSHMFVFYNGEQEILDMLPSLMKKANETKSKLLFITSLSYSTPELFRKLANHAYHHVHKIVYGELFTPNGREQNVVTMFLQQAKKFGKIEIPNDGLGKLYPVLLDDVFSAIIATAFASERRPQWVCVFPAHPVTELSVARMLQKNNPLLRIDFRKYKGSPPQYHIPKDVIYFYSDYPLEKKIQSVASHFEIRPLQKQTKRSYAILQPSKRMSYRLFWLTLLFLLLSPILLAGFLGVSGAASLQLSVREIDKGNIAAAQNYAVFGKHTLTLAEVIGSSLFYLDPFMKTQKKAFVQQVSVAKRLAITEVDVLTALRTLQHVSQGKSANPKKEFKESLATLKNSLITVQKMRAEGELPNRVAETLDSLEPVLVPLVNTIDALPAMIGFEGKRTYLVLFQNNMELRPGGGFIGSYGLLTVDQGKIATFTVHDVYDADGRLTAHIEPPYGLRRYLGASHWFFRDSNFAIDFPQNAKQAITFLQLETGEVVDGVIAVDTSFLQNILAVIGPVTVADYKEVVTAENFYLRTQTHAEKDFFPGSTQKKDFLGALLTALEEKLAQKDGVNVQQVLSSVGESIRQKHVLFAFSDTATQQLLMVNNLAGSLVDIREQKRHTYLDFFGVVDANVGVNKTNYYLKRTFDHKVGWSEDGKLTTTATITYTNTSKKDSQFGGDYKNYVRFVLPPNVQVREVVINGVKQSTTSAIVDPAFFTAEDFIPPKELEIERSQEQGKELIGFLILVPTGQSKTVTITYEAVSAVASKTPVFSYDLRLFKQPGTLDDSYAFSFSYPPTYQVTQLDKVLSDVGGKLVFSDVFSEDREIKVEFSKK